MPYEISWLQDKRVCHVSFSGQVDPQESVVSADATSEYVRNGEPPVHVIVDVSKMEKFPANVRAVYNSCGFLKDQNLGWIVVVGANTMVNFISGIVTQVARVRLTNTTTIPDALKFLKKQDMSLTLEESVH